MSRLVVTLTSDIQLTGGLSSRTLLLFLLMVSLAALPGHSETWSQTASRTVKTWITDALYFWGLKDFPVPSAATPPQKHVARTRVEPANRMYLNALEFRQKYNFIFKGIVTASGLPTGGARVIIRVEYDGHPQLMEVITAEDGSYSADMPFVVPVNSRVDWTLQIRHGNAPILFEKSGRSIVTRDELDILIEEPVEYHAIASAK